ncbi:MAG: methyltransferase domain-containing protein [Acidimicrobiales bacterium]
MDQWADLAGQFVDVHYGSLRGKVRTHVLDRQLSWHVPSASVMPARIVDVGGGAGNQSVPLARAGHHVTIVDSSPAMLGRATDALSLEAAEVATRVRLVQSSGEDAPRALDGEMFDVVLCHGVIMYVPDPPALVASLARLARPSGLVSIAFKNAASLATRPALQGDWAAALKAFGQRHQTNGLGVDTVAHTLDEIVDMLGDNGVEPVAWYGVRLFTDGWVRDMPEHDEEELVMAVELEASRRDPYRQMSRMLHIVGTRFE